MSTNEPSRFSRELKLEVLRRMDAGENVSVLARELGVLRKSISKWRDRYRVGGCNAARPRRISKPSSRLMKRSREEGGSLQSRLGKSLWKLHGRK